MFFRAYPQSVFTYTCCCWTQYTPVLVRAAERTLSDLRSGKQTDRLRTLATRSHCQTSQKQHFVLYYSQYIQNRKIAEFLVGLFFSSFPLLKSVPVTILTVSISVSHKGPGKPSLQLCCFTRTTCSIRGPSSAGGFLKHCRAVRQRHSYTTQKEVLSCTNHELHLNDIIFS